MESWGGGREEGAVETHRWEVAGGAQRARVMPRQNGVAQGIPQRTLAVNNVRAKRLKNNQNRVRSAGENSGTAARSTLRSDTIRKKIIGHRMAVGAGGFRRRSIFGGEDGAFTLLHQPASKHGRSVLLEPLVEQFRDLLAEIGSVGEARKFKGLQGGAGSGEKKFPGSLGTILRHRALPKDGMEKYHGNINSRVIDAHSNNRIIGLWKSVEKKENAQGLCSGCAGDYEDPDWSAWEEEEVEETEKEVGGEGEVRD